MTPKVSAVPTAERAWKLGSGEAKLGTRGSYSAGPPPRAPSSGPLYLLTESSAGDAHLTSSPSASARKPSKATGTPLSDVIPAAQGILGLLALGEAPPPPW